MTFVAIGILRAKNLPACAVCCLLSPTKLTTFKLKAGKTHTGKFVHNSRTFIIRLLWFSRASSYEKYCFTCQHYIICN